MHIRSAFSVLSDKPPLCGVKNSPIAEKARSDSTDVHGMRSKRSLNFVRPARWYVSCIVSVAVTFLLHDVSYICVVSYSVKHKSKILLCLLHLQLCIVESIYIWSVSIVHFNSSNCSDKVAFFVGGGTLSQVVTELSEVCSFRIERSRSVKLYACCGVKFNVIMFFFSFILNSFFQAVIER